MSDFLDKMIADLKEGAERSEGFMRGGRVGVEVARERRGREAKLANHPMLGPALGAGLGSGLAAAGHGPMLAGPAMAALSASAQGGSPIGAGAGSYLGGSLGGLAGSALGKALFGTVFNPEAGALVGGLAGNVLGSMGGAAIGSSTRDERSLGDKLKDKLGALEQHYTDGTKAAANHFGLKEAFLGALGSLAGGALLRGGLGAAAGRFGGSALGRAAGGVLNAAAKPGMAGHLASGAIDMAGSMAGGAIGNRLQGQGAQG